MDFNKKQTFIFNEWVYWHKEKAFREVQKLPEDQKDSYIQKALRGIDSIRSKVDSLSEEEQTREYERIYEEYEKRIQPDISPNHVSDSETSPFNSFVLLSIVALIIFLFVKKLFTSKLT